MYDTNHNLFEIILCIGIGTYINTYYCYTLYNYTTRFSRKTVGRINNTAN